jgi:hypothetical protein
VPPFCGLNMPPHPLVETDSIAAAVAVYKSTWDVVDDIVAAVPELDTLCQDADPPTNLPVGSCHTSLKRPPATPDTLTSSENSSTGQPAAEQVSARNPKSVRQHSDSECTNSLSTLTKASAR